MQTTTISRDHVDDLDLSILHTDLVSHVRQGRFGLMLDHPLCRVLSLQAYASTEAHGDQPAGLAAVNAQYAWKIAALEEAKRKGDWMSYVFLHERPYRVDVLLDLQRKVPPSRLWSLVRDVWTDTEQPWRSEEEWIEIWSKAFTSTGKRKQSALRVMTAKDRAVFENLPAHVRVWRGCSHIEGVSGFSWTLDRRKAEWFAQRFASGNRPPVLAALDIAKSKLLAYTDGRKEKELILMPWDTDEAEWTFLKYEPGTLLLNRAA